MMAADESGIEQLRYALTRGRYSLFRLETLQNYSGTSEDAAFTEWQRSGSIPLTDDLHQWCERVRGQVSTGCRIQRVHVVTEPLTPYLRFELASYAPNVEAGEDVRIIPVPQGDAWPADVPQQVDFWLIDSRQLWSMRYASDGHWLGAEPITNAAQIVEACATRDAALAQSHPWRNYQSH